MDPTALGKHCDTSAILTPCLTQSQFVQTSSNLGAQTNWGNIPPNAFYGPGYFDIDTQVTKTVRIRERMNLQIGASIYNTLNHPNFGLPVNDLVALATQQGDALVAQLSDDELLVH